MKLTWSHAVLNVHNLESMLDFYMGVLGFTVSDRGPLGETRSRWLRRKKMMHRRIL